MNKTGGMMRNDMNKKLLSTLKELAEINVWLRPTIIANKLIRDLENKYKGV